MAMVSAETWGIAVKATDNTKTLAKIELIVRIEVVITAPE
jgi:hypothetical protein